MKNYLFITIDSLRYDVFEQANIPNIKAIAPFYKAYSYAPFTYASHMAMFVGFTPGNFEIMEPYVNPRIGKIFRVGGVAFSLKQDYLVLDGKNIIDGFNKINYETIGTASMRWFDPAMSSSYFLISEFKKFYFAGRYNLDAQINYLTENIKANNKPKFAFLNIGETHLPYYYKGADWDEKQNYCEPFGKNNNRGECEMRQQKSLEYIDRQLKPLLDLCWDYNIVLCSDHGDAWGEDGLWGHGFYHPKVLEVPLLFRLADK